MSRIINPMMIVLARESREISQSELAAQLKITQGALSRMESGSLRISPEIIDELSEILSYPKEFFFQTYQVYPPGMHFYRAYKTLPSKVQQRISSLMNIQREHIKKLLESAEIEYKPVPECDLDEYGSPAEVAKAVRQYLRLPRGRVDNITEILEDMGIVIVPVDVGTRMFSGASIFTEKPNYIIYINSEMSGDRFRWTLAHELGHIVMHRLPSMAIEEEADLFASEFLMPSQEIGQYLSKLNLATLANLKRYWKTSMASILVHAYKLGKITERQYRSLWTEMSKAGYKQKEPIELDIPREQPTLLKELLDLHTKDFNYSLEDLSSKLICRVEEFEKLYSPPQKGLKLIRKVG